MSIGKNEKPQEAETTDKQELFIIGAMRATSTIGNMLSEVEKNLDVNRDILAFLLDSSTEMQISAGEYEYPFQFQLPVSIPSSFVGEYGRIAYSIKGVIDRPWRFDHETVAFFTVVGVYDLNLDPYAAVRILFSLIFKCVVCVVDSAQWI